MANTDDMNKKIPAVVLAGGINDQAMRDATGVENRAMVELAPGKTMLDFVLGAVKGAPSITNVVVVGDIPDSPDYTRLPSSLSFLENLIQGIQSLPPEIDRALIVTSDIPFISSEAIDDFVIRALAADADLCYPIIPMEIYRKEFAALKRTTLKLSEGEFTGGNIMLMSCDYIKNHQETILQAYGARKDVLKLGSMLGWGLLLRIIVSQIIAPKSLDIASLENGVSNVLGHGAKAKAVITQFASLGTDVDKPNDVIEAKRILGV
jgi:2-phospho-L-lactate guanylyltransferase (CobY/MobA/RfbA family)